MFSCISRPRAPSCICLFGGSSQAVSTARKSVKDVIGEETERHTVRAALRTCRSVQTLPHTSVLALKLDRPRHGTSTPQPSYLSFPDASSRIASSTTRGPRRSVECQVTTSLRRMDFKWALISLDHAVDAVVHYAVHCHP